MQPDWLSNGRVRWLYSVVVTLTVGLIIGSLFGLTFGSIFAVSDGLEEGSDMD